MILLPAFGKIRSKRFQVESFPGDLRRFDELLVHRDRNVRFACGTVHASERVCLCQLDGLLCFTACSRDHSVVLALRLVDQRVSLLLRLVHRVEGRLHRFRRIHILQHHLIDADTVLVLVAHFLQTALPLGLLPLVVQR